MSESNRRIVQYQGTKICTESFGDNNNPTLLLIAGATVSMLYWDIEFCRKLAGAGFFVIRYDNRDTGKSTSYSPGTTPYDIIDLTNDAIAILDAYEVRVAHFAGISLGGLIAQVAALKYTDRVATLTLIATGPWGDSDPDIPEMDTRIMGFQERSDLVNWKDEEQVVTYMVEGFKLMSGSRRFDAGRIADYVRHEYARAENYITMFNHASIGGGEEYWNKISDIKQPALIIHGTEDKIWHFKNSDVLLGKIKHSTRLILEGTGHEIHVDDWNEIIDVIVSHRKMSGYEK